MTTSTALKILWYLEAQINKESCFSRNNRTWRQKNIFRIFEAVVSGTWHLPLREESARERERERERERVFALGKKVKKCWEPRKENCNELFEKWEQKASHGLLRGRIKGDQWYREKNLKQAAAVSSHRQQRGWGPILQNNDNNNNSSNS